MAIKYLKKAPKTASTDDAKTREIVQTLLKDLETVSYTHLTLPTNREV